MDQGRLDIESFGHVCFASNQNITAIVFCLFNQMDNLIEREFGSELNVSLPTDQKSKSYITGPMKLVASSGEPIFIFFISSTS